MCVTKASTESAEQTLQQLIRQVYKWLICPVEEFARGRPALQWEAVSVSPAAQNLVQEIENKLHEEEWLISEWSPVHLTEVNALKIYQDCCHYLYLPRLQNDQVLKDVINKGLDEDFFGFAGGKEDEKYLSPPSRSRCQHLSGNSSQSVEIQANSREGFD